MKVLVSFNPNKKYDNFEGTRLRKNIKGALELHNVPYTTSDLDDRYDVMHLVSSESSSLEEEAMSINKPVVVSALMGEDDPTAAYLDFKYHDGNISYCLPPKKEKFLNNADLVLVPAEGAKKLLLENGVTSRIEILKPGINLARFDFSREEEKDLFFKYFREERSKKLVVAVGDYSNMEGINAFIQAGTKCPEANFYFFGQIRSLKMLPLKVKKIIKKSPKNIHFMEIVPDDIYRSALLNASVFMVPSYHYIGTVIVLEAMAAKCEIVAREQAIYEGLLKDQETAHLAKFSETLAALVKDALDGKVKSTITEAYKEVQQYSLENIGEKLINLYQEIIDKKKEGSVL
jgi:1,2-diacylglycerol-3-alpha-glucose alpha-1,2-glucosyltransferase